MFAYPKLDKRQTLTKYPDLRVYKFRIGMLLLYSFLRLVIVVRETQFSAAFSHDSAYIGNVARNLLSGKGLVNDASWLVFLNPNSLPMPFHNANPLYPVLIAGISKVSGISVVKAGFLLSTLASILLVVATYLVVHFYTGEHRKSFSIAYVVAMFPHLFSDSLKMLPDALHLALLMCFLACLIRSESLSAATAGGIFFGLAWLTRSTAIFIVPAGLMFAIWRFGWRKGMLRILLMGIVATAVAFPWFLHTKRVWGSPFRSDANLILQDYYSRAYGDSVERFWHSPIPPPAVTTLLQSDGKTLVSLWLTGLPSVIHVWLREPWGKGGLPSSLLMVLLILCVLVKYRQFISHPLVLTTGSYAGVQIAVLAMRFRSSEPRYLSPLTALLVIWLSVAVADCWRSWHNGHRQVSTGAILFLAGLLIVISVPLRTVAIVRELSTEEPESTRYRRALIHLHDTVTERTPVVLVGPYFYSFDTGNQALSIPTSDDDYLVHYMQHYGARWIFLSDQELSFWKPKWVGGSMPPVGIRIRVVLPEGTLYERIAP